jgi:hypothetical protein
MAAFFFPEVHRKSDFIWSGIGFFYALVLWVCAGRMTGGVLLGQVAGVSLIGWLGWQTLTLRRSLASPQEQTEISPEVEEASPVGLVQKLLQPVGSLFQRQRKETPMIEINRDKAPTSETEETAPSPQPTEATETPEEAPTSETAAPAPTPPEPPEPELAEAAKSDTESKEPLPDTPVEEVAPEAEISPDAEPRGPGDTNMRQSPPEPPTAMEAVPVEPESEKTEEKPENPPEQA